MPLDRVQIEQTQFIPRGECNIQKRHQNILACNGFLATAEYKLTIMELLWITLARWHQDFLPKINIIFYVAELRSKLLEWRMLHISAWLDTQPACKILLVMDA